MAKEIEKMRTPNFAARVETCADGINKAILHASFVVRTMNIQIITPLASSHFQRAMEQILL